MTVSLQQVPQHPAGDGQQNGGANGQSAPAVRDALFRLLDAEIEHERAEEVRGGWTTWALLIGLAGLMSLAADMWERGNISLPIVGAWFTVGTIAIEMLALPMLGGRSSASAPPGRFRLRSHIGMLPKALAVQVVRYSVLVGVAIATRTIAPAFAVAGATLVYSVTVVLLVAILVAIATDHPQIARPLRWKERAVVLLLWAIAIAAGVGYLTALRVPAPGHSIADIRLAALCLAIFYLLVLLLTQQHREPLLLQLVEVRRALTLDAMEVDDAWRRARIILRGLALGDWVEPDVRAMLTDYQQLLGSERGLVDVSEKVPEELAVLRTQRPQTAEQIARAAHVRSRLDAIDQLAAAMEANTERIKSASVRIAGRIGYFGGASGDNRAGEGIQAQVNPLVSDAIVRTVKASVYAKNMRQAVQAELIQLGY